MNKSFFSRFKDKLESNYGGRYFSVILRELIIEDYKILKILFPSLDKEVIKNSIDIEIDLEYEFPSASKTKERRYADLAVIYEGKPVALLEVKDEDEKSPTNEDQLKDYIAFIKNKDICFTYLTQYYPPKSHLQIIKKRNSTHLFYSDLYKKLKRRNNPAVQLFCKFLEENTMKYTNEIHEGALWLLLMKGFNLKHNNGYGKKISKENITQIPELISTLTGNLKTLGNHFYNDFEEYFNKTPSINFYFDPLFKFNSVNKESEYKENIDFLSDKSRVGGEFRIYFRGKVKQKNNNNYLYITCGFCFRLDENTEKNKTMKKYIYANVYGQNLPCHDDKSKVIALPKREDDCYKKMLESCEKVIGSCLGEETDMPSIFKTKLKKIKDKIPEVLTG